MLFEVATWNRRGDGEKYIHVEETDLEKVDLALSSPLSVPRGAKKKRKRKHKIHAFVFIIFIDRNPSFPPVPALF